MYVSFETFLGVGCIEKPTPDPAAPATDAPRPSTPSLQAAKRDARAETGMTCEHGIWRCKICFPHKGVVSHMA